MSPRNQAHQESQNVYGPKILVISFSERLKLSVQGLQILLHFHHPSKAKAILFMVKYRWLYDERTLHDM